MSLSIAYVNYGFQSGVTGQVIRCLSDRGHRVTSLNVIGPLEYRHEGSRRPRLSPEVLLGLLFAFKQYGREAMHYRWNTTFAFDRHSAEAARSIAGMETAPDVVLQAGALFSPGLRPSHPYVLLLDNTRQIAMRRPPEPEVGLGPPVDYGPGWHRREGAVYRGARAIGTFSARVCDSLVDDYGVERARTSVVGAGANVFPEEVERADDGETILFVGTRWELKGGPVLARAFERLRQKRPKLKLWVVGPGSKPDLPAGATWFGYVPASELASWFARATIFALPTLREAFGIAYVDAMACGVPCVGTAVEAVPEILVDGETGLLVPPSDDVALARALETLLADRERARRMGEAGRRRVAERFLWEHVAERLEGLLLDAVGRPRPGALHVPQQDAHVGP